LLFNDYLLTFIHTYRTATCYQQSKNGSYVHFYTKILMQFFALIDMYFVRVPLHMTALGFYKPAGEKAWVLAQYEWEE
jgi:hypothetical protein